MKKTLLMGLVALGLGACDAPMNPTGRSFVLYVEGADSVRFDGGEVASLPTTRTVRTGTPLVLEAKDSGEAWGHACSVSTSEISPIRNFRVYREGGDWKLAVKTTARTTILPCD